LKVLQPQEDRLGRQDDLEILLEEETEIGLTADEAG
jgi:hypothetical protein